MYRVKEGIIGCAVGDAFGYSSKGQERDELLNKPVLKMLPSIKNGIPKGSWSDSTSLTLATMNSICKKNIDYNDIAECCVSWITSNKYCSVNESFGIGKTTLKSLIKYTKRELPAAKCGSLEFEENGNSSLKMILPFAYYFTALKVSRKDMFEVIKNVCSITHRQEISICACYIYFNYLLFIMNNNNKFTALKKIKTLDYSMFSNKTLDFFSRILIGNLDELEIDEIRSSSFVVDTLEAGLWCFIKGDNYKNSVIGSANIGGDTSSISAITGTLSALYYGIDSIPKQWINDLRKYDYLVELSENYEKFLRFLSYK